MFVLSYNDCNLIIVNNYCCHDKAEALRNTYSQNNFICYIIYYNLTIFNRYDRMACKELHHQRQVINACGCMTSDFLYTPEMRSGFTFCGQIDYDDFNTTYDKTICSVSNPGNQKKISTWLLTRGKEMVMLRPEGRGHYLFDSRWSITMLLWTLKISFLLLHDNCC